MRKLVDVYRRLFQRTKNDENLREDRKKNRNLRSKRTITTLRKQDGFVTRNTKETMEVLLDYLFEEDHTKENQYQKQIRKTVEQPIKSIEDIEFSREEIEQAIESFNDKKHRELIELRQEFT